MRLGRLSGFGQQCAMMASPRNLDKCFVAVGPGMCIGVVFCDGLCLALNACKVLLLVIWGSQLAVVVRASPATVAAFSGPLQWSSLLCRPAFAVLDKA